MFTILVLVVAAVVDVAVRTHLFLTQRELKQSLLLLQLWPKLQSLDFPEPI